VAYIEFTINIDNILTCNEYLRKLLGMSTKHEGLEGGGRVDSPKSGGRTSLKGMSRGQEKKSPIDEEPSRIPGIRFSWAGGGQTTNFG
jgi:hypothetical protein